MSVDVSTKVTPAHLSRTAYLYIRQSTLRQVMNNTESTVRQYALRQRAIALGWPVEQIVVIDTDQGHSGASALDREGFQRLVGEVGMGRAGIVLGLEVSRLARNSADWHRLLEICALSDTLILDEDGLYDPSDFNDRLLLGLKGTMSEAELHFITARLRGGLLSKARRGELRTILPVGLVYDPVGRVTLDPDTGVQRAVRYLFSTFSRTGSARATVQLFRDEGLLFPVRVSRGARKGELAWTALRHWRVLRTLHNPRYAGTFAYGQSRTRKTADGKITCEKLPRDKWTALIPEAHPGYISFSEFETNLQLLAANAAAHARDGASSPPREGPAILQGLAICGRCGNRMTVAYHQRHGIEVPGYRCMRKAIETGSPVCSSVPGVTIDAAIGELLLDAVTPLSLEVALKVQAELETRSDEADSIRHSHVVRARHQADLARRRYMSVDPDNRLVADSLEADWNDALRHLREAEAEYEKLSAGTGARLTEDQKERIRSLATNFPRLWSDPNISARERKRVARLLIEDVTIIKTDKIHLHVRFRGGKTTSLSVAIPPTGWQARQTNPDTLATLDRPLDTHTDSQAAEALNRAGHISGMAQAFTPSIVLHLRRCNGLSSHLERLRSNGLLTATEFAERLGVSMSTVKAWNRAGLLISYQANDKNTRLFAPPTPGDPRLVKKMGSSLAKRALTQP